MNSVQSRAHPSIQHLLSLLWTENFIKLWDCTGGKVQVSSCLPEACWRDTQCKEKLHFALALTQEETELCPSYHSSIGYRTQSPQLLSEKLHFLSTQAQQLWLAGSRVRAQQLWPTGLVAPRHVGSSRTRARTHVSCTGRRILNHCTTREAVKF